MYPATHVPLPFITCPSVIKERVPFLDTLFSWDFLSSDLWLNWKFHFFGVFLGWGKLPLYGGLWCVTCVNIFRLQISKNILTLLATDKWSIRSHTHTHTQSKANTRPQWHTDNFICSNSHTNSHQHTFIHTLFNVYTHSLIHLHTHSDIIYTYTVTHVLTLKYMQSLQQAHSTELHKITQSFTLTQSYTLTSRLLLMYSDTLMHPHTTTLSHFCTCEFTQYSLTPFSHIPTPLHGKSCTQSHTTGLTHTRTLWPIISHIATHIPHSLTHIHLHTFSGS